MSETTKIAWATASFSPWIGCAKVHTGCVNCYAAAMAGRLGVVWGQNGTRRRTAESTWRKVEKWDRDAYGLQCHHSANRTDDAPRPRVFPSLCDPFEDWRGPVLDAHGEAVEYDDCRDRRASLADVRRDFFDLIDRCLNLDFLLLTKRPENVRRMWGSRPGEDSVLGKVYSNVWLLYSASDQASLESGLPHLLACRDLVPVLGLSLEPLIGPVDLRAALTDHRGFFKDVNQLECCGNLYQKRPSVDWVIVGGESGPRARPCDVEWIRSIIDQCRAVGVPCFVKQLGSNPCGALTKEWNNEVLSLENSPIELIDPKGGDPDEWPEDLRVRELPNHP